MLLKSIEDIAEKVASMAVVIYALEKTKISNNFFTGSNSNEMLAVKVSALLSGSEFIANKLLEYTLHHKTPTLYNSINDFGYAFVSNTIVLYAMEKLSIDDKIINGSSDETKAIQWAVLFAIVQEISYRLLQLVIKSYF
jgi:hypothetical protein